MGPAELESQPNYSDSQALAMKLQVILQSTPTYIKAREENFRIYAYEPN